jgi:formate hydrogenlyase subunit 3/multisubunit Na+/H+ antiporter MnhD subunit
MTSISILLPIVIPLVAGLLILPIRKRYSGIREAIALIGTLLTLAAAIVLFRSDEIKYSLPWAGLGIEFLLRLYRFSAFIILATSAFAFLFMLYCSSFYRDKKYVNQFYSYLLFSVALANGAVLADNLVVMLFFWEGLLLTTFGLIALGGKEAFRTATKAFIIIGVSDLCLMVGIGIAGYLAGTLTISQMRVPAGALGSAAFIFMMIGAISKAGSAPFHTWIPDAAVDAPLPFMAFLPASLEKLLGIYLLTRISLDMFKLNPGSWLSVLLMTIGAITIVMAVMMALIQKDYKKLLSYHAISQVGYMILGVGTCLPAGIIGGLFHMINNALYKSCLFLTAGSVEKQTGTTNLYKLGGLWSKMPVTFVCFLITAASISGVPPFNGFFSKELVYEGALERGAIFYLAALVGSFFTAASFLKLGHAAFFGKPNQENAGVKDAPWPMLIPMIVIASICVCFGVYNRYAITTFIEPVFGGKGAEHHFAANTMLIIFTVLVLAGALLHHLVAARVMGGGSHASDHIRNSFVLKRVYDWAEKRYLDPYDAGMKIIGMLSRVLWLADRAFDWLYNGLSVGLAYAASDGLKKGNTGNYSLYIVWSLVGGAAVLMIMMK